MLLLLAANTFDADDDDPECESSCECDNIRDVHNLVRFLMTGAHEVETSGQTLRQSDNQDWRRGPYHYPAITLITTRLSVSEY